MKVSRSRRIDTTRETGAWGAPWKLVWGIVSSGLLISSLPFWDGTTGAGPTLAAATLAMLWFGIFLLLAWRPYVALRPDQLIVRIWRRTTAVPLPLVTSASSTYYGTYFHLSDGRTLDSGVHQTPNHSRWFGRYSRADDIAWIVVRQAAILRGESAEREPPSRGIGNLSGALGAFLSTLR